MKQKTGILDEIRQWLERCPQCNQVWLIFNRKDGEWHRCKGCRHKFLLGEGRTELKRSESGSGAAMDAQAA